MAVMGEEAASAVYRHLSEAELQLVTKELAELGRVSPEDTAAVLEEYGQLALTRDAVAGGIDFATRSLVKAFGQDAATNLLQKAVRLQELGTVQLESLQKADPQQLARFLEGEHPQTIALILAHLDGKQASALLMKLPGPCQAECIKRLAQLRQFSPEMAEKISTVLNRRLLSLGGEPSRKTFAGLKSVAEVMNQLQPTAAKGLLESIERDDPKTAISIRNLMFTFEDLLGVADTSIREWLGAMDKKTLAIALKGTSPDLRDHIFRAMSSRAVQMLKEDMEALGPVRSKEVSAAQQEAVTVLRTLEAAGRITLKSEGADEYVV
jgi:flagellar motor switch protein FliG